MLDGFKQYVRAVALSWGKAVSGPVFAVLSLLLLVSQLTVKDAPTAARVLAWGSWLTLAMALLFVLVAQFRVWRDEHQIRCDLQNKLSADADIRGPVWIQLSAVNPNADQTKPASAIGYTFDCSNHGRVACELNKVIIKLVPPDGFGFNLIQDLPAPQLIAPGRAFKYDATCGIQGVSPEDLRKSTITVFAVDSLGNEYRNTETKITNIVLKVIPRHNARPIRLSM